MVLAENAGHGDIIFVFEIIHNQKPRIFLIGFLDLLFGQVSHAGDLTVEIIRMSRAVAGDIPGRPVPRSVAQEEWVCTMPPIFGKAL